LAAADVLDGVLAREQRVLRNEFPRTAVAGVARLVDVRPCGV